MYHSYSLLSPILLLMLSLLSKADNGTLFIECVSAASYDCGRNHYNITYPFRLLDSPEKCGLPGFELTCNTDQSLLTINIGKKSYRIKSIDYANRVLTIIDPDLTGEDCPRIKSAPVRSSCPSTPSSSFREGGGGPPTGSSPHPQSYSSSRCAQSNSDLPSRAFTWLCTWQSQRAAERREEV